MVAEYLSIVRNPLKSLILLCVLAPLVSACVSRTPIGNEVVPRSIAVLGVTAKPGVEAGTGPNAMSLELQSLIHERGDLRTLRSTEAARAINSVSPGAYSLMMASYARTGTLDPESISALVAARLPTQMAIIARIVENDRRDGPKKEIPLRNNLGDILTDRRRIVLSTVREMHLQATMVNLGTGAVFWTRTYKSTPSSERSYVHYTGSSFSGSLAAHLANTMTTGLRTPAGPAAPSNQLTLRSLFREVVRNIP